jgi:MFS family permease
LGWGYWADKRGNKIVLIASSALLSLGTLIAFTAHSNLAFELLFALTALGSGGIGIAGGNMLLEMTPSKKQTPAYLGTMNTLLSFPRSLAPLLGGLIALRIGLNSVFALATLAALISLIAAFQMKDPRLKSHLKV